jgi:threonine synthase
VLTGLAPNGGLYIPEHIPLLPDNWKSDWSKYSFVELSVAVLSLYISPSEISLAELRALVERSYATFRHPDITPLHRLDERTFVLELFHGPTFAFKDVALQLLGNLFEFFLLRRNARKQPGEPIERLTVLGATSGDTGRQVLYTQPTLCCDFDLLISVQRCDLRSAEQSQHIHLHPPSKRARLADSRGADDDRHR